MLMPGNLLTKRAMLRGLFVVPFAMPAVIRLPGLLMPVKPALSTDELWGRYLEMFARHIVKEYEYVLLYGGSSLKFDPSIDFGTILCHPQTPSQITARAYPATVQL